uniref:Uncharacterized protein n=1 Tax=Myoviridae sp. ctijX18 TaxID=2825154 RepID=A0A8S5USM9_9CAUD|nr:MAG TPA: hypothetical protein [Myoviridae sp. ctijX18]DAQ61101.1 MAG TPA: hypothetical protein [Caudoviricetes sp.]
MNKCIGNLIQSRAILAYLSGLANAPPLSYSFSYFPNNTV